MGRHGELKKKLTFPEPSCRYDCQYFKAVGDMLNETCYCMRAGRKNGRRFQRKDIKRKPPEWCPLRLNPPVCRIYGFKDDFQEMMEHEVWCSLDPKKQDWCYPLAYRYQFRREISLGMSAAQFYAAVQSEPIEDVLGDTSLKIGELIEIDNGLKPQFFYCYSSMTVIPAKVIALDKLRKSNRYD